MEKHLQVHGNKTQGFSAHYDEAATKLDANLKPCPFCGSDDLEIQNTHTPCYSVVCVDCGGEVHGRYSYGKRLHSHPHCVRQHRKAFDSAVIAWNTRA